MSITSFGFLALLFFGLLIYYIVPRGQWLVLLAMSLVFYYFAATPYTIVFLCISILTAYAAGGVCSDIEQATEKGRKRAAFAAILAVLINFGMWFALRGTDLWVSLSYRLSLVVPFVPRLRPLPVAAALGMGYYTLQVIGYILDCYWGTVKPQKNPVKLFLFVIFFPQLTTGPISRYSQLETLYERHRFSYENVAHGMQRILWGFLKKLVLAERVGILINGIWGNLPDYTGWWRWVALLLYPVQMYADFSGSMDIVIGAAEIFGIVLPENFRGPFFSRTAQEFWQRWHITLGAWAKDYVLYPLLKCKKMVKFGRITKKKFGKRIGKFIPTAVSMFVLWMVMGVWHGSFKYVLGVSLWYWIILMLGELLSPVLQKLKSICGIHHDSFSWHFFQSARTYLIYAVGAVFFRADGVGEALEFLKSLITMFQETPNTWIFFDGSVLNLGVTHTDLNIILFCVLLLLIVDVLQEKYGYARNWMAKQILPFRWFIWLALFVFVLIYGQYGPGYDAAEFIYQGF